jgi:hypothetical protein
VSERLERRRCLADNETRDAGHRNQEKK